MEKRESDREAVRAYMRRRRAAVTAARAAAKAKGEKYVEPTLELVYQLASGVCYLCGEHTSEWVKSRPNHRDVRRPTLDHVVALNNGGLHCLENTRLACWRCNRAKSDSEVA